MSSKGETNRKWTSSAKYRASYDRIFAKVCDHTCANYNAFQACALHLDALTTAANNHRLAQYKQLCAALDCQGCDERLARVRDYLTARVIGPYSRSPAPVAMCPAVHRDTDTVEPCPMSSRNEVSVGHVGRDQYVDGFAKNVL